MKSSETNSPHFTSMQNWSDSDLNALITKAIDLKQLDYKSRGAEGKLLALLFLNPSLRTKVSFEAAAAHLGATVSIIQPGQGTWLMETQPGVVMDGIKTEHVKEAIQVLSAYCDAIGVRVFSSLTDHDADATDSLLNRMAEYASVPVINLESAREHPCQALADWMTLRELFGNEIKSKKLVLSWAPHPNPLPVAVPNSVLEAASRSGINITLACPQEMLLDRDILARTHDNCKKQNTSFNIEHNQLKALEGADVVYAKSWASGLIYEDPDGESIIRKKTYSGWTLTEEKMNITRKAKFMHCLPVRRNVVVTDGVLDSDYAVHIQQAENRLHVQKALLMQLWKL